ncbi:MAG: hypothetical protein AAF633_16740, partial [Chloroflexota bacterium]
MQRAIEHIHQAIHFGEKAGNQQVLGIARRQLGSVMVAGGQIDQAIDYMQASLRINQSIGKLDEIAVSQIVLGGTLGIEGRFVEALEGLNAANLFFEQYEVINMHAICLSYRSHILCRLGRYEAGWQDAKQSEQLAQRSDDRLAKELASMALAYAAAALGQYDLALEHAHKAVSSLKESQNSFYLGIACLHCGEILLRLDRADMAAEVFREALQIYKALEDQGSITLAKSGLLRALMCLNASSNEVDDLLFDIETYVEGNPQLKNLRYPLSLCLHLYHALADRDPQNAVRYLKIGEGLIERRASQIADKADLERYWQQAFKVGEILNLLKSK